MFHSKMSTKAAVPVGTCWPDTGVGGVADCLNWTGHPQLPPTPPVTTKPENSTMYPWGHKMCPANADCTTTTPQQQQQQQQQQVQQQQAEELMKQPYPWDKDPTKINNTAAPDMNRWQLQRAKLNAIENAVDEKMHKTHPQTAKKPPRRVEVLKDKYVTMCHDGQGKVTVEEPEMAMGRLLKNRPPTGKHGTVSGALRTRSRTASGGRVPLEVSGMSPCSPGKENTYRPGYQSTTRASPHPPTSSYRPAPRGLSRQTNTRTPTHTVSYVPDRQTDGDHTTVPQSRPAWQDGGECDHGASRANRFSERNSNDVDPGSRCQSNVSVIPSRCQYATPSYGHHSNPHGATQYGENSQIPLSYKDHLIDAYTGEGGLGATPVMQNDYQRPYAPTPYATQHNVQCDTPYKQCDTPYKQGYDSAMQHRHSGQHSGYGNTNQHGPQSTYQLQSTLQPGHQDTEPSDFRNTFQNNLQYRNSTFGNTTATATKYAANGYGTLKEDCRGVPATRTYGSSFTNGTSCDKSERTVKFAENSQNIDSARWLKSKTPSQMEGGSRPSSYYEYGYGSHSPGGVHVAVEADPDAEVTIKVTPTTGEEMMTSQSEVARHYYNNKYGVKRKPPQPPVPITDRMPWR